MSELVPACALGEVPVGTCKAAIVNGTAIVIVRTQDGVFALKDACSHADVALSEGEVNDGTIECWLHGSAFDLRTGEPLGLPAVSAVPVYSVTVDGEGDAAMILVADVPAKA